MSKKMTKNQLYDIMFEYLNGWKGFIFVEEIFQLTKCPDSEHEQLKHTFSHFLTNNKH